MIVADPGVKKPVRTRNQGGRVANGKAYVKVMPKSDRPYIAWSQLHLRLALSARGIPGFSKSKHTREMAGILTQQEKKMGRSTPYLGDFTVKGRSCARGIFWRWKKSRTLCQIMIGIPIIE